MGRKIFAILTTMFLASTVAVSNAGAITINFDSLVAGIPVTTIDGVTFSYAPALSSGFPLVVSTGFPTSSMPNYLGVQDGGSEFFQPGDAVNLVFGTAIKQLDVTFIAPSGTPDGAFGLSGGLDTVTSTSADMVLLDPTDPTSDEAFTLHLTPSSSFSNAALFSDSSVSPQFSIDDIVTTSTVPEPGTLWLMGIPAVALAALRKRISGVSG